MECVYISWHVRRLFGDLSSLEATRNHKQWLELTSSAVNLEDLKSLGSNDWKPLEPVQMLTLFFAASILAIWMFVCLISKSWRLMCFDTMKTVIKDNDKYNDKSMEHDFSL